MVAHGSFYGGMTAFTWRLERSAVRKGIVRDACCISGMDIRQSIMLTLAIRTNGELGGILCM
jgi:hypothetical protein